MQPGQTYTRADILDALNLSVGVWNSAIPPVERARTSDADGAEAWS